MSTSHLTVSYLHLPTSTVNKGRQGRRRSYGHCATSQRTDADLACAATKSDWKGLEKGWSVFVGSGENPRRRSGETASGGDALSVSGRSPLEVYW